MLSFGLIRSPQGHWGNLGNLWTCHVDRVCRSRLTRSLARASKGVMHVWARPFACCFRMYCRGVRRARASAGALAVFRRFSVYASYWAANGVILNHVWSKKSWCLDRTVFSICRIMCSVGGGATRKPSCSHTRDCVGCRAISASMVSSTIRTSKYSKRRNALSLWPGL